MLGKVGIVGCSNGQPESFRPELERLIDVLWDMGFESVCSPHLFARESVFSAGARERAAALMEFYLDDEIDEIFDISGGDLANEVLPWLDYDSIANARKRLWGYSDLTCVLNAIYARTGMPSMLYQVRNFIGEDASGQRRRFGSGMLEQFEYQFLQGQHLEGVVVGGNVRCLLKLAGTPYWPEMRGRILLLEGLNVSVAQAAAYIAQLDQLGALDAAAGILLGTFTRMEARGDAPDFAALLQRRLDGSKPLVKTYQIGHGADSRAVCIGGRLTLDKGGAVAE
ncbi:MAG: LD-carboxypeptidase [Candidatus Faecivicinus sp.]